MLAGYDKTKGVRRNRYFIYDLSRQQWLTEFRGGYLPKGGTTKQHCAAFKTGGKTKIFLSGYAYNTNIGTTVFEQSPEWHIVFYHRVEWQ